MNTTRNTGTALSVAGGTLMSVAGTLSTGDVVKTIVLAAVGATVSFFVSLALRRLMRERENKKPKG